MFLATLLTIFNLAVCFSGTYAWFVAAQANSAENMQVQMYTHELDMSYRVYKYDDDQKGAINATGKSDALQLQKYDSVIKSRNVYTPIIIEFMITGMSLGEDIPVFVNTHCSNDTTDERVLSNIIQMKFAVIPTITSADPNDIYFEAVDEFDTMEPNLFIVNNTKRQDITYELSNYSESIVGGNLRLYILLDYHEGLIDNFEFSYHDSQSTAFDNDLERIVCVTSDEN